MRWFLSEVKGKLLLVDWVLRLDIVLCLTHWTPLFMLSSSFHLKDMDVSIANVTPLNCDNQSAIQIAHNLVFYEQKKNVLRLTVISFIITFFMGFFIFDVLLLRTSLLTSSPSPLFLVIFVGFCPNSSSSLICRLEFEGC